MATTTTSDPRRGGARRVAERLPARLRVVPGAVAFGTWTASVAFDVVSRRGGADALTFSRGAYWLVLVGVLAAAVATTLARLTGGPAATRPVLLADGATATFLASFLVRGWWVDATPSTPLVLLVASVVGLGLALAALPTGLALGPTAPREPGRP